jgi:hypothetical protein
MPDIIALRSLVFVAGLYLGLFGGVIAVGGVLCRTPAASFAGTSVMLLGLFTAYCTAF